MYHILRYTNELHIIMRMKGKKKIDEGYGIIIFWLYILCTTIHTVSFWWFVYINIKTCTYLTRKHTNRYCLFTKSSFLSHSLPKLSNSYNVNINANRKIIILWTYHTHILCHTEYIMIDITAENPYRHHLSNFVHFECIHTDDDDDGQTFFLYKTNKPTTKACI